jgi:hypothetical protein
MSSAPKKKPFARALAHFVPEAMGEALAKQGFAGGEIVLRWGEIAGPELARRTRPLKLQWPRRRGDAKDNPVREPAVLLVQVESAFALDLQMQAPALMERINRYFGWRCVGSIKLKQGPVGERRAVPAPDPVLSPEQEAQLQGRLAGIEDERLSDALARLGRAIACERAR